MISDARILEIADRIAALPDVVGVALGGSRARGEHTAASDVDLGVYYRGTLDTGRLGELAAEHGGQVSGLGEWGPWVNGGGWLEIDGTPVDWIFRDLDRVERSWADATAGRVEWHYQLGHPAGVTSFAYAGELALARVLADPSGELERLRARFLHYPQALSRAIVGGLFAADFSVVLARKAITRGDSSYVAGCLFTALTVMAHALHAASGRWLINEKNAVAEAGRLPLAPDDFAARAQAAIGGIGTSPGSIAAAIDPVGVLVAEVQQRCEVAE